MIREQELEQRYQDFQEWLTVDYENIWETKLSKDYLEIDCDMSDYTYGHIFKREVK